MATLMTTYGAYGADAVTGHAARTAYAGEVREADTGWYMLGQRAYSPTLRRFLAPDSASPVEGGGINRYAYCSGDPVNRIDPSGRSWMTWIGASLGLAGKNTGAAGSVSPASQRMHEGASTPVTMASTAAAVVDTVSISSAIDSVALTTSAQPKARGLFGWLGAVASATWGGLALPATKGASATLRFFGQTSGAVQAGGVARRPLRHVEVTRDNDIPATRLTVDRRARAQVTRNWRRGIHTANPHSQIWAADSEVNYTDFPDLFAQMKNRGIKKATVYSGVDGSPRGKNWEAGSWFHVNPQRRFYLEDLVATVPAGKVAGINIDVVDIGDILKTDFQDHLSRDGVHIIGACYGIADEYVMEALNLSNTTVYYLSPPPKP